MLKNTEIRVGNLIGSGVEFNEDTSLIGEVISIGNDEQEFEQVYCECDESFEWFFKDNYCGIPIHSNESLLLKLGFVKHKSLIQTSYGYVLDDYTIYDDIIKQDMFHYKEVSLTLCNDKSKREYYVL